MLGSWEISRDSKISDVLPHRLKHSRVDLKLGSSKSTHEMISKGVPAAIKHFEERGVIVMWRIEEVTVTNMKAEALVMECKI